MVVRCDWTGIFPVVRVFSLTIFRILSVGCSTPTKDDAHICNPRNGFCGYRFEMCFSSNTYKTFSTFHQIDCKTEHSISLRKSTTPKMEMEMYGCHVCLVWRLLQKRTRNFWDICTFFSFSPRIRPAILRILYAMQNKILQRFKLYRTTDTDITLQRR